MEGTVSGVAHYHGRLENDASTNDGDASLEAAGFTGIISPAYDAHTGSSLNVECDVDTSALAGTLGPGVTTAEVSMQLSFGTDEDPELVMARVTTTYRYEELVLMLFPHQTTARFTDTYALTRVA